MKLKSKDLNFEKEKLELIKWITTLKDETSIERLKMIKANPNKSEWWNEISQAEKDAIDKGLNDIGAGKVRPHKDVKKMYEKWL
jgi:hypothetical protein